MNDDWDYFQALQKAKRKDRIAEFLTKLFMLAGMLLLFGLLIWWAIAREEECMSKHCSPGHRPMQVYKTGCLCVEVPQ